MHDSPTTYPNVIGSQTGSTITAATLTAAFSGNRTTLECKGFKKFLIEGIFTPGSGSTNQQALILFETSTEETNSGPTNFYPFSTDSTGTTEIDVFADSGYSMSTASGIPLVIPGDKTSTAGQAISFSEVFDNLCTSYLRVSARDSGSANFGTLYARITFFPN